MGRNHPVGEIGGHYAPPPGGPQERMAEGGGTTFSGIDATSAPYWPMHPTSLGTRLSGIQNVGGNAHEAEALLSWPAGIQQRPLRVYDQLYQEYVTSPFNSNQPFIHAPYELSYPNWPGVQRASYFHGSGHIANASQFRDRDIEDQPLPDKTFTQAAYTSQDTYQRTYTPQHKDVNGIEFHSPKHEASVESGSPLTTPIEPINPNVSLSEQSSSTVHHQLQLQNHHSPSPRLPIQLSQTKPPSLLFGGSIASNDSFFGPCNDIDMGSVEPDWGILSQLEGLELKEREYAARRLREETETQSLSIFGYNQLASLDYDARPQSSEMLSINASLTIDEEQGKNEPMVKDGNSSNIEMDPDVELENSEAPNKLQQPTEIEDEDMYQL
ncbi:hypothetical protein DFH27DRAFT_644521 [Peziza echinospora]|nr:hypothetical protein DFH27DRAFT_644521 [Peziza echinospora]